MASAPLPVLAGALALLSAGAAAAQSNGGGSAFNAGYGMSSGELSRQVNVSRAVDASGNHVVVDGVTRVGDDQSVFYSRRTGGAGDTYGGVGALGAAATAVGNNLVVSVQGSNNTVVVNSTQINNGAVTAKTVLNGKVDIDGTNGGE